MASLHMHGQELAQSHLNAPIQTQLRKQKREGASFFKKSRAPNILHTSTCWGRSRKGRGTILNLFPPAHLPEYHEMVCHICFSLLKHPSKLSSSNCLDLCQVIFLLKGKGIGRKASFIRDEDFVCRQPPPGSDFTYRDVEANALQTPAGVLAPHNWMLLHLILCQASCLLQPEGTCPASSRVSASHTS